jgi:Tol biopolymer transport system component/DNA-binding winged helix-turn-helix (wHTH) protein
MELLILLVRRHGELVSRDEIIEKLWGRDVFIETELGINTAVSKIRHTLGDDPERPRFVQTVVGKGYRFISELRNGFEDDARQPEFIETIPKSGYRLLVSAQDANGNSFEESPDRLEAQSIATPVPQSNTSLGSASILPRNLESRPASHPKSSRRIRAMGLIGGVIVFVCVALGIRLWKPHQRRLNLEDVQMVRLTESGNAEDVAISPNGEYVVYVLREGEKRSLRVLQVATGGEVQILASDVVELKGLTFSPDGNYIFFLRTPKENFLYDSLFQMPVLGGTPRKLIYDIDTPISFSPDGKQFTFIRIKEGTTHLIIANADGTGERVLASHPGESFDYPAWSPDGRTIAFPGPGMHGEGHVWAVSPLDARMRSVYTTRSTIGRLHWLPDSNGLLAVIRDSAQGRGQLWYISYPSGEAKRVTNDLADYALGQLDLTGDGKSLVAVESAISSDLWVVREGDAARAQQITSGRAGVRGIAAGPEGTIIFANEKGDLYSINEDGSAPRLLTPNMHRNASPSVCRDGRHIVFESAVGGQTLGLAGRASNIWKMETDGSHRTQLTLSGSAVAPLCSPDSESVQYFDIDQRKNWRIPMAGGTPTQVDTQNRWMVARSYSPDGKLIAYDDYGQGDVPNQAVVLPATGGEAIYEFRLPQGNATLVHWTQDGTGLDYFLTNKGVGNIWRQPVPKGLPRQVTNFTSGQIFSFDWSSDGKRLYVARGSVSSDIVLITKLSLNRH